MSYSHSFDWKNFASTPTLDDAIFSSESPLDLF